MKLIMENWRNYTQSLNRDRYLEPGADPSDPTPEQEDQFDDIYTRVSDMVADAQAMPGEVQKIGPALHIMYDPEGDQFMTFTGEAPESVDNYRDLFYGSEKDEMIDTLANEVFRNSDTGNLNESPGPDGHGMLPHARLAADLSSRGRGRSLSYGDKNDLSQFLSTLGGETGQNAKTKIIKYLVDKRFGNYVDYT